MARLPPAEMAFRESQWVSASPPWPPREAALWASPHESVLQRERTLRRGGTGSFQGSGGGEAAPTPLRFPPPSPANHPVEKRRRPCGGGGKGGEGRNQESSCPGPFGLAFGDESLHAFLLIFRAEQEVERAPLVGDPVRQERLKGVVDRFLAEADRQRSAGGDLISQPQRFFQIGLDRNDAVDQPQHQGLLRRSGRGLSGRSA